MADRCGAAVDAVLGTPGRAVVFSSANPFLLAFAAPHTSPRHRSRQVSGSARSPRPALLTAPVCARVRAHRSLASPCLWAREADTVSTTARAQHSARCLLARLPARGSTKPWPACCRCRPPTSRPRPTTKPGTWLHPPRCCWSSRARRRLSPPLETAGRSRRFAPQRVGGWGQYPPRPGPFQVWLNLHAEAGHHFSRPLPGVGASPGRLSAGRVGEGSSLQPAHCIHPIQTPSWQTCMPLVVELQALGTVASSSWPAPV
jgi:hypothetical protein